MHTQVAKAYCTHVLWSLSVSLHACHIILNIYNCRNIQCEFWRLILVVISLCSLFLTFIWKCREKKDRTDPFLVNVEAFKHRFSPALESEHQYVQSGCFKADILTCHGKENHHQSTNTLAVSVLCSCISVTRECVSEPAGAILYVWTDFTARLLLTRQHACLGKAFKGNFV